MRGGSASGPKRDCPKGPSEDEEETEKGLLYEIYRLKAPPRTIPIATPVAMPT